MFANLPLPIHIRTWSRLAYLGALFQTCQMKIDRAVRSSILAVQMRKLAKVYMCMCTCACVSAHNRFASLGEVPFMCTVQVY
jgi:hypothetical protein